MSAQNGSSKRSHFSRSFSVGKRELLRSSDSQSFLFCKGCTKSCLFSHWSISSKTPRTQQASTQCPKSHEEGITGITFLNYYSWKKLPEDNFCCKRLKVSSTTKAFSFSASEQRFCFSVKSWKVKPKSAQKSFCLKSCWDDKNQFPLLSFSKHFFFLGSFGRSQYIQGEEKN